MSKLSIPLVIILLLSIVNFGFSTDDKTQDSISKQLQELFKKYEKIDIDSTTYYGNQLIKHSLNITNDSLRISTHLHLGNIFILNRSLDSSLYHYNTALNIASINGDTTQIIRSLLSLGDNYFIKSEFKIAIGIFKEAIHIAQEHHFKWQEAISFLQLGNIYWEQGNLQKALWVYLKANTIIEENNFKSLRTSTLVNIANVYSANKQWDTALDKLESLLIIAKKDKKINLEALVNNNIGTIYEDLKEYKKALPYYIETLRIQDSLNNLKGITLANQNLGSVNFRLGNYSQAIIFLNKSMASSLKTNSKLDLVYDYEYLSRVYIKLRDFDKVSIYLTKSIAFAEELGLVQKKIELIKLKSKFYFEKGQLNLAYITHLKYDSLKDHLVEKEKSEKIIQMQTQYETEKKEKENELLKTQNQLSKLNLEKEIEIKNQFILGFIISLVLLVIIILQLRNRIKVNRANKDINIQLEESNEKLQVINSTKDKFFSIIAHDLRSPLGAILSFSNLIDDESNTTKDVETITEYNSYLNQSAHNLFSLLENLLEWSKSQLGSINYRFVTCELSDIVQDNIEIQKLKAKEKSIEIITELDSNIQVIADINMLNTVIRNLLNNAVKFSFPKSKIIVSHKIKGNMLHLSVKDQGMGISQIQREKLFKIDSNLSTLGTNNETGTGLGLILCKEFVVKNGGTIWIESEEGKGSVFTFSIPLQNS